jgi:hypothetical protein
VSTPEKRVSFIIPHKGREELLQATLASIAAQDSSVPFDVTVVTQNERLLPATHSFSESMNLQVIHGDAALTISALRNLGARQTDGDHLAFLDADIELAPNWLSALLAELDCDPARVLVSAVQRCSAAGSALERIRTTLSNAAIDSAVAFLPGRNLLLSRSVFDRVGGFPEHLRTCEDYWFTDQVARHGQLWYSSATSYIHLGEDQHLAELFSKEVWRGQSNLASLAGRRVSSGEWPSFFVPPWITLFAGLGMLLALTGRGAEALFCLLLAAPPFAAYVTRLYLLGSGSLSPASIVAFYVVYFPARAWGSLIGVFRRFGEHLHDR